LIGTLTAREHLTLYARIRGMRPDTIDAYVTDLLEHLTLTTYADRQASTYSGGTKRKLSLGIALVGSPKIVFLDEPTTGVDPESKRFMWTLLNSTMEGRSVILTTHSMDECEALCARIGIMVNGMLVCLGSAAHLKERHGSGYQFEVTFKAESIPRESFEKTQTFLHGLFGENVSLVNGAPGAVRLCFALPRTIPVSRIFELVEASREDLAVAEYSISESTLDQIFVSFARDQVNEDTLPANEHIRRDGEMEARV